VVSALAVVAAVAGVARLGLLDGGRESWIETQVTLAGDVWRSALSPDGTYLAYVAGSGPGDMVVRVRDLGSSSEVELLDAYFVTTLQWSPDGTQLLVGGTRGLRVLPRLGGDPVPLGSWHRARWLPDGAGVVVAEDDRFLVRTGAGAVDTLPLPDGTSIGFEGFDLDPLGERVAFATIGEFGGVINVVDVETGTMSTVVQDTVPMFSPRWDPDGRGLRFLRGEAPRSELVHVDLRSGDERLLRQGMRPFEKMPHFSVTATGSMAYVRSEGRSNLWLAARASGADSLATVRPITSGSVFKGMFNSALSQGQLFRVSPDGRSVAFVARSTSGSDVFGVPVDGGSERQVTYVGTVAAGAVWDSAQSRIAFVATRAGERVLSVVDLRSSRVQSIEGPRPFPRGLMAWAPGGFLAFAEENDGQFDVRLVDPAVPHEVRTLTQVGPLVPYLAYDERGQHLALASGREVVVVDLDGLRVDSVGTPFLDPKVVSLSEDRGLLITTEGSEILQRGPSDDDFELSLRLPWPSAVCEEVPGSSGAQWVCAVSEGSTDVWLLTPERN
jgi:Tol biopolymer transport system component